MSYTNRILNALDKKIDNRIPMNWGDVELQTGGSLHYAYIGNVDPSTVEITGQWTNGTNMETEVNLPTALYIIMSNGVEGYNQDIYEKIASVKILSLLKIQDTNNGGIWQMSGIQYYRTQENKQTITCYQQDEQGINLIKLELEDNGLQIIGNHSILRMNKELEDTLNDKISKTNDESISGVKTFEEAPVVPDTDIYEDSEENSGRAVNVKTLQDYVGESNTFQLPPARMIFSENELPQVGDKKIIDLSAYVTVEDSNQNIKDVPVVGHGRVGIVYDEDQQVLFEGWEMNYINLLAPLRLEIGDKIKFRMNASDLDIQNANDPTVALNLPIVFGISIQEEAAMQQEAQEKLEQILPLINIKAIKLDSSEIDYTYEQTDTIMEIAGEFCIVQTILSNSGEKAQEWNEFIIEITYGRPLYKGEAFDYNIGLGPTYQGSEGEGKVLYTQEEVTYPDDYPENYIFVYDDDGRYPNAELITNKERRPLAIGENLRITNRDMKLYVKTQDDFITYEGVREAPEDGKIYGRKDGYWEEVAGGGTDPDQTEIISMADLDAGIMPFYYGRTIIPADTQSVEVLPTAEESMQGTILLYEGEPTEQLSPGNYYSCEWYGDEGVEYAWMQYTDFEGIESLAMPSPDSKYEGIFIHYIGETGEYEYDAYYDLVYNSDDDAYHWEKNIATKLQFLDDSAYPIDNEALGFMMGINTVIDTEQVKPVPQEGYSFVGFVVYEKELKQFSIELEAGDSRVVIQMDEDSLNQGEWESIALGDEGNYFFFYKVFEGTIFDALPEKGPEGFVQVRVLNATVSVSPTAKKIPTNQVEGLDALIERVDQLEQTIVAGGESRITEAERRIAELEQTIGDLSNILAGI